MAFYGDPKAQRVGTADIAHFRAPYKDWISLSAADELGFSAVVTGHLLYATPEFVNLLMAMTVFPSDATPDIKKLGDPSLVEFGLSSTVPVAPSPSAVDVANGFVQQGYAVLVSDSGLLVATKDPKTVARFAKAGQVAATRIAILAAGPDIGLKAEALATQSSGAVLQPGSTIRTPIKIPVPGKAPSLASMMGFVTGPFGITILVLGAAGLAYMFWAKKKTSRRYVSNKKRRMSTGEKHIRSLSTADLKKIYDDVDSSERDVWAARDELYVRGVMPIHQKFAGLGYK